MSASWNCVMYPYLNQSHMRALGPPFLAHYNHESPKGRIHLRSSTGWDPGGRWPPEQNQDSVWNEEGAMGMDVELATQCL